MADRPARSSSTRAASRRCTLGLAVLLSMIAGCRQEGAQDNAPQIAVTNSYLECAVRDLFGGDVEILCLAPPGMCPGHFDISPAQVRQLGNCRILLLFDFQQEIEQSVSRLRAKGLQAHRIEPSPGLCVPDTYLAICRQVCQVLAKEYPPQAVRFDERLLAIQERLDALGAELKASVLDCRAAPAKVLSSNHQAAFATWLGLEPVATFIGNDIETISNIDLCLKKAAGQEVRFVVANLQEGAALAQSLADRLQAGTVVFSNFPESCGDVAGFDRLLRDNVRRLAEAAAR